MKLFDQAGTADFFCSHHEAGCVHLALGDLQKDLRKVSGQKATLKPFLPVEEESLVLIGTVQNPEFLDCLARRGVDIKVARGEWETYQIKTFGKDDQNLLIVGSDPRGTMWGIYEFARLYLGIDPLYYWTEQQIQPQTSLDLGTIDHSDGPQTYRYRGWFINDEDLLTEWKNGGGKRYSNYYYYHQVVHPDVLEKVIETALRLKQNLMIPASLLNIDNPAEENLVRMVTQRGMFVTQHHIEPLGVSHFSWDEYWKKQGRTVTPSFITEREAYREIWTHYAQKWAQYDNVIWQLGLRGRGDRPVWFHDQSVPPSMEARGALISDAMTTQKAIVEEVLGHQDFLCTTTLWMEGSELHNDGFLTFPQNTMVIFADHGPTQMWGEDFYRVARKAGTVYGVYYHVAFWGDGPHLVQGTSLEKLHFNYSQALEKGDTTYSILNVTNLRETVLGVNAVADLTWDFTKFQPQAWLKEFCARHFGTELADAVASLYHDFYHSYFPLENERFPSSMAFIDGMVRQTGLDLLKVLAGEVVEHDLVLNNRLIPGSDLLSFAKTYGEATRAGLAKFESVYGRARVLFNELSPQRKPFFRNNLIVQLEIILGLYGWLHHLASALEARETHRPQDVEAHLRSASFQMDRLLLDRTKAEQGPWEHWYRGDKKMNLPDAASKTRAVLEKVTRFQ